MIYQRLVSDWKRGSNVNLQWEACSKKNWRLMIISFLTYGTQETNFLIVVRFTFFNDKETVLRAKRNLKSKNIFIAERLQKWVRDIRKRLFSLFKAAKEENKKCRMVYDHYRQVKIRFYYSHGQPNISKPGNRPWYADCVSHPRCQQKYHMRQGKLCTSDSF